MRIPNKHYYKVKFYRGLLRYIKHRLGFHNNKCRRRLYTTEKDYICLVTGKTHKKFELNASLNLKSMKNKKELDLCLGIVNY